MHFRVVLHLSCVIIHSYNYKIARAAADGCRRCYGTWWWSVESTDRGVSVRAGEGVVKRGDSGVTGETLAS